VERLAHWRTRPRAIIANSNFTANSLKPFFSTTKIQRIYCPVRVTESGGTPDTRRQLRAELGTMENAFVVIFAARLERWKGIELHLDSVLGLAATIPWESWILGAPQSREERLLLAKLEARAKAHPLGQRVRFLGRKPDIARYLAAADVNFQPNLSPEPFGIAFIEAMAAGLPIVSRPEGAIPEITSPETALLSDSRRPEHFVEVLTELARDPALRARFRTSGPARARQIAAAKDRNDDLFALLERLRREGVGSE